MADSALHITLAVVTAAAWYGAGSLFLARARAPSPPLLAALNRIGLGALTLALLTAAAGWLGLLYTAPFAVVHAALAAIAAIAAARRLRTFWWWRLPLSSPLAALALLLVIYGAFAIVATCAPVTSADALYYHTADVARFAREHQVQALPWSWLSYQPFTVEMLMMDGQLLRGPIQAAFAPCLLAFGAVAAVGGAATRLAGARVGLLAAAIFAAQPFMLWQATSSFPEPGIAFCIALALWNLGEWRRNGSDTLLVLAATYAWATAGMKYTGILLGTEILAVVVLLAPEKRKRVAFLFVAPAMIVALPWYIKNALLTGDPAYPFLFGGANADARREAQQTLRGYGFGRSPEDAVLLFPRLLLHGDRFDRGDFISPLFAALAPLALLDTRFRRTVLAVLAAVAVYLGAWFVESQQARFLMPLMVPLAILGALGGTRLASQGRAGRVVVRTALAGALVAGLAVSTVYTRQFVMVVVGRQSTQSFLEHKTSFYNGVEWINGHLSARESVLIDFGDNLYVRPDATVWTADALAPSARPMRASHYVRHFDYVAVFASNSPRIRQLTLVPKRLVARVPVRAVTSRTRSTFGPVQTLLVYRVQRPQR